MMLTQTWGKELPAFLPRLCVQFVHVEEVVKSSPRLFVLLLMCDLAIQASFVSTVQVWSDPVHQVQGSGVRVLDT